MLHIQHILPWARCLAYNKSVDTWVTGKHKLCCPWADVALGLCPRDNINPLCNITCVYQLPMYQLLLLPYPYVCIRSSTLIEQYERINKHPSECSAYVL